MHSNVGKRPGSAGLPSLHQMENEVIGMTLGLLNALEVRDQFRQK